MSFYLDFMFGSLLGTLKCRVDGILAAKEPWIESSKNRAILLHSVL